MTPVGELVGRLRSAAFVTGPFVLPSGRVIHEYFDEYLIESDPVLLKTVAEAMLPLIPIRVDALAGLELGGIPLVTALSQVSGLPCRFVRKQPKPYGTFRHVEGGSARSRRVVLIDDVVRSGTQMLATARALSRLGAEIRHAVCVLDRQCGGKESLARFGITLSALVTATQLRDADPAVVSPGRNV